MTNQQQGQHEPAKKAPQVAKKTTSEPKPRKRRGFFSQLFSHLMVATLAVIAVSAYMHWRDVLKYTGARVCSYNVLGKYAQQPAKVPPIDLKKPASDQSNQSNQPAAEKTPAQSKQKDKKAAPSPAPKNTESTPEKPAEKAPKKTSVKTPEKTAQKSSDKETGSNDSLEAARKLFWAKDPATPAAYEKLIAKNPEDAALKAELGNAYFKFGKKDLAADQYLQAGKLFAKQKNTAKADEMMKILEKLAPEKAKELSVSDVKDK